MQVGWLNEDERRCKTRERTPQELVSRFLFARWIKITCNRLLSLEVFSPKLDVVEAVVTERVITQPTTLGGILTLPNDNRIVACCLKDYKFKQILFRTFVTTMTSNCDMSVVMYGLPLRR